MQSKFCGTIQKAYFCRYLRVKLSPAMRQNSVGPIRKLDFVTIGELKLFPAMQAKLCIWQIRKLIFVTIGQLKLSQLCNAGKFL